jgi:hypothetical protein
MKIKDFEKKPAQYKMETDEKTRKSIEDTVEIDPKIDPNEYSDAMDYALSPMALNTF